ncbi:MAG TPA: SH3 domain-containing protein [Allosphingosinicella sp.]|jgi:SH3-like domain-containing protein
MLKRALVAVVLALGVLVQTNADAQRERQPPYWVSVSAGDALMRTGPAETYPALWRYRRRGLPMRVVATHPNWRKLQDPEGASGWMMVRLLSDVRTALVIGGEPRAMHESADGASRVRYLAEPGVVGRIEGCSVGWCEIDVGARRGFIRSEHVWGVDPDEDVD